MTSEPLSAGGNSTCKARGVLVVNTTSLGSSSSADEDRLPQSLPFRTPHAQSSPPTAPIPGGSYTRAVVTEAGPEARPWEP